jgi:hypothetical protein
MATDISVEPSLSRLAHAATEPSPTA